jgi:hypothetical protein
MGEGRLPVESGFALEDPDVLCVQELTPEASELIAATLPAVSSVDDPVDGSAREDDIFWDGGMFEAVEHGTVDINILSGPRRVAVTRRMLEQAGAHYVVDSVVELPGVTGGGTMPRGVPGCVDQGFNPSGGS